MGYTHYPIRFNRKTQKVYAFSPQQQKIIELNWQDLRFSTVEEKSEIELRASKVNQDNLVEDEIILSYLALDYKPELAFLKAYMVGEDLQRLDAAIPEFFDIYNRKETWKESFERLYMGFDDYELIHSTSPSEKGIVGMSIGAAMWLPWIVLRHIAILLSKLPQWPAYIEYECQIEKDDPYDSTGKQRHLAPLVFTWTEKLIIFIGWLVGTSLLFGFLVALAVFSLNTW